MSTTVFHAASARWLPAAYAKQLDDAMAAAQAVFRSDQPRPSGIAFVEGKA